MFNWVTILPDYVFVFFPSCHLTPPTKKEALRRGAEFQVIHIVLKINLSCNI